MKPGTLASAIVIVALMAWCGTLHAQESSGDLQQLRSRLRQLEVHLQQLESELHQLEDDLQPEGDVKPDGDVPKSDVPKSDVQPVGSAQPATAQPAGAAQAAGADAAQPEDDAEDDVQPEGGVKPKDDVPKSDARPVGETQPEGDVKPKGDVPTRDVPKVDLREGDEQPGGDRELEGELQLEYDESAHKDQQSSLLQLSVYVETDLSDNLSVFFYGDHDSESSSTAVGLARKFGQIQAGIGVGQAIFDNTKYFLVNPWLYFSNDSYKAYLHAEHYGVEHSSSWYKGYLLKKYGKFSIGPYGTSSIGVGPRLDVKLSDDVRVWGAVPVMFKPDPAFRYVLGVSFEF